MPTRGRSWESGRDRRSSTIIRGAPPGTAMRVDVIIPCHNAARYIADALESVMRQTHRDLAVVVVDDGSNDDTVRIARGFGARVTVLEQANKGPSAARNTALRVSRGECVAFLDAD